MFRWVNKGAKGIALLGEHNPEKELRYVYDLSDTHPIPGGKRPFLWHFPKNHTNGRFVLTDNADASPAEPVTERVEEESNAYLVFKGEESAVWIPTEATWDRALDELLQEDPSSIRITIETEHYVIDGRKGTWSAVDEEVVDGRSYFLMQSEKYGDQAKFAVVDEIGRTAAEDTKDGFDSTTLEQIRETLNREQSAVNIPKDMEERSEKKSIRTAYKKPEKEIWERYLENGDYFRRQESATEDGYSFIDGRNNNYSEKIRRNTIREEEERRQAQMTKEAGASSRDTEHIAPAASRPPIKSLEQRVSVLKRLREKQAQIAAASNLSPSECLLSKESQRTLK